MMFFGVVLVVLCGVACLYELWLRDRAVAYVVGFLVGLFILRICIGLEDSP